MDNMKAIEKELQLQFVVTCGSSNRGIYLRECHDLQRPQDVTVTVEPRFRDFSHGMRPVYLFVFLKWFVFLSWIAVYCTYPLQYFYYVYLSTSLQHIHRIV